MAQFFYQNLTLPASPTPVFPITVKVGFQPAYIKVLNLTQLTTPVATNGYLAEWWYGMPSGAALITDFGASATFFRGDSYITTGGITLLNQLGSTVGPYGIQQGTEQAQYGANLTGFTNANPGVLTVDSTYNANITAGSVIRVANVADNQGGTSSLNGNYYVASVTGTTITLGTPPAGFVWQNSNFSTLSSLNTSGFNTYISGGSVTLLQNANPALPNPPFSVNSSTPSWYNEAVQGFTFAQTAFPGASAGDNYLIQAWSNMVVF